MSGYQSNLSLSQYGYDLVVSTTQESINATMKQFLDKFEGKEFISCYVSQRKEGSRQSIIVPGNYGDLQKLLGRDLFEIPTITDKSRQEDIDAADKAYKDGHFRFAFKATMGLPDFPLDLIPNVIILNQGSVIVTYNLFFKDFKIINAEQQDDLVEWTNLSQTDEDVYAPWVFQFNVKLDLNSSDGAFIYLPESVQNKVKNLNPDSAFSVQQLYLDLNTAGLETAPKVVGLEPTSTAYTYLTRVFINSYFKQLQEQSKDHANPDGNILLGYSVKPTKPSTTSSSIIPTDLTFMVSPFHDENGVPTKNYDLYTLNYLVMSNSHHMPAPVEFGWNWIEKSEDGDYHGTMTIKKDIFVSFLNQTLSPSLQEVCIIPTCDAHVEGIVPTFSMYYEKETTSQKYQLVNDGTAKVLTFFYSKSSQDRANVLDWVRLYHTYTFESNIYLENNIIRSVSTAIDHVRLILDGGVTDGNIINYQVETSYQISVDSEGSLIVTLKDKPQFSDLSASVDADIWSKIASFGGVDDFLKDLKNELDVLRTFLNDRDSEILAMLNGSSVWVFPGAKTFVFKDVYFSNYQDLVAHVTYVDPEDSSIFR